jgi:hypothetical protein
MSKGPMSDEQKEKRRIAANKNREKHSLFMKKYWENRREQERDKEKDNSFMKYLNKHNK